MIVVRHVPNSWGGVLDSLGSGDDGSAEGAGSVDGDGSTVATELGAIDGDESIGAAVHAPINRTDSAARTRMLRGCRALGLAAIRRAP